MTRDTPLDSSRHYHSLLRALSPEKRLEASARLTSAVRELAMAGLVARHPLADSEELRRRLAVRLYGREAAGRWYGSLPADAR